MELLVEHVETIGKFNVITVNRDVYSAQECASATGELRELVEKCPFVALYFPRDIFLLSDCIGSIVVLVEELRERNGQLVIISSGSRLRDLFNTLSLNLTIPVFDSLETFKSLF